MTSAQVVTIIAAVIAAVGTSLTTGLLSRPKTAAEARSTSATGEVAISGDAREWALIFMEQAKKAEAKAAESEARCDELERKFDLLVNYTRLLQRELATATGNSVPPPPDLVPPLHP